MKNGTVLNFTSQPKIDQAKKEATQQFFTERIQTLSMIYFPSEAYHSEFKEYFQRLLVFNSKKQMGVLDGTWDNMCTFNREFFLPEMEVCFEVLLRCRPSEMIQSGGFKATKLTTSESILKYFNETYYPKILSIVNEMRLVWDNIDKQISVPIADRINASKKISLQIPIGQDIKFVIPNITTIRDGK